MEQDNTARDRRLDQLEKSVTDLAEILESQQATIKTVRELLSKYFQHDLVQPTTPENDG